MASKKEEMRIKRKRQEEKARQIKDMGIIDINDESGEDIVVETFEDAKISKAPQKYQTMPKKEKLSLFQKVKKAFSEETKNLKRLDHMAEQVLALEPTFAAKTDEELKAYTSILKERLNHGETMDDILIDAYALVREGAKRCLGLVAFKVQIMGAIALHEGDIAEMKTGEGKTLTSIFPVYLNALQGQGVHVVTVNQYLAGRDKESNGLVYEFLGLTVGLNDHGLSKEQKKAAHACDITYTTNAELGFDYLRDNMVSKMEDKVLRPLNFALVDEVDSILIDESRTPLIISGGRKNSASLYVQADRFVKGLKKDRDYEIDIESKAIYLTEHGIEEAEKFFKINGLYDADNIAIVHHINQALRANYIMSRDVEYVVATSDGSHDIKHAQILIIDQFTGRVMPGRQYNEGLHQALEAKEGVPIKEETITLANITYQNFFRLFKKLAGMTGTAKTEEEEFRTIYNMRVIEIPTNRPVIRDDRADLVFSTMKAKFNALCQDVMERNSYGQPVLIGTVSVETSELLSKMLKERGIRHNVLNAKNHAREAEIIAKAGVKGAVTIATNMAGRGTDIKLGEGVAQLGGLAVIGSERHESRRIDNQLRGRSGRQGDPGYSCFYVSFEDELMQRFAGERLQKFSGYMENEAIESKMITRTIENAQKRVEGQNFDMRKALLQYDEVMREQREIIYKERDAIMNDDHVSDIVQNMYHRAIEKVIRDFDHGKKEGIDIEGVVKAVEKDYFLFTTLELEHIEGSRYDPEKLCRILSQCAYQEYSQRFREDITPEQKNQFECHMLLSAIDYAWINHIDAMDKLRNGIHLRATAQRDPLQEYTNEAFEMFEAMTLSIAVNVARSVTRMGLRKVNENLEAMIGRKVVQVDLA